MTEDRLHQIVPTMLPTYNTYHHNGNEFSNLYGTPWPPDYPSPKQSQYWKLLLGTPDFTHCAPFRKIPPEEFHLGAGIRFWWIGHSTCLFQFGETFIITDPIFTTYGSPIIGYDKRVTPPACSIEDLPKIDYVLISHDHYDHLDRPTMKELQKRFPDMIVIAGLKMDEILSKWVKNIVLFDWRQTATLPENNGSDGINIICFPANHYTNRKGWDGYKRLWCSFLLEYHDIMVYFPGDTSLGPHFPELTDFIDRRPIHLVTMPIGPSGPPEIMRMSHLDPKDAYDMSMMINAKKVVPIHWGTFPLGLPPPIPDIDAVEAEFRTTNHSNLLYRLKVGGALQYNRETDEYELFPSPDVIIPPAE